ncbi:MAG: flavodoxin family protein [Chloroflexi bacterium]|nr:MAG: flavodoxin family protein [Chloroflexota bacterium]
MPIKKSVLVINGHPSTQSLNHSLSRSFADGAQSANHSVTILDIYQMDPQLPIVNYQTPDDWKNDQPIRAHYQQMIADADVIAIFHPLWWGGWPALLKNFIDQTLTPGFAYHFDDHSKMPKALVVKPKGLLKGKKVRVFITYDAYTFLYIVLFVPFIITWALFVLFFCGITNMRFTLHQRVRFSSSQTRGKWIERAFRRGRSL